MEQLEFRLNVPVVAIVRGLSGDFFQELMAASFDAGLQAIEVTLNTPDALDILTLARHKVPRGHLLGAGTVCTLDEAKSAIDAGAMFLVSPNTDAAVISYGRQQGVPVVAGALTPSEVYHAYAEGASLVKVFPVAAMGGASYIRALRGPYDTIPLMPVGGVRPQDLAAYFEAGATAVGVGASFFGVEALAAGDIKGLTKNVENYIKSCLDIVEALHNGS